MIKVVSWNIAKRHAAWRELCKMDADVALLQEAGNVPSNVTHAVDDGPRESWDSQVWNADYGDRWPTGLSGRWCKVVKLSERVEVEWFKQVSPISMPAEDEVSVSGIGTIAVARISPLHGEPFIAVSMWARWMLPHKSAGSKWRIGRPDVSAHRIISDISGFVGDYDPSAHRVLAAGDLNISYNPGGRDWDGSRDQSVWSRLEAIGMKYLGPHYPNGRKASRNRDSLAPDSLNVPTYRTTHEKTPELASQQLDYAFASHGFHREIRVSAMNGIEEWGPSDHCRVLIEVDTGTEISATVPQRMSHPSPFRSLKMTSRPSTLSCVGKAR